MFRGTRRKNGLVLCLILQGLLVAHIPCPCCVFAWDGLDGELNDPSVSKSTDGTPPDCVCQARLFKCLLSGHRSALGIDHLAIRPPVPGIPDAPMDSSPIATFEASIAILADSAGRRVLLE
jgi:hypothetical protein